MTLQILVGCVLGCLIGLAAWRIGALSSSGAVAAALAGGLIFSLGGIAWAVLLLAFFISSSTLTRVFSRYKTEIESEFAKGSRRDAGQVLANGGLPVLLVLFQVVLPGQTWIWVAFAGAVAAVNADTWATELGVLSPTDPRLVTTGQQVPRGTSGAVSLTGILAALAGGGLIAMFAAVLPAWPGLFLQPAASVWGILAAVSLGGLFGALFDSLLGATLQAIYFCPQCTKETERYPVHVCGTRTEPWRGWPWLNNDWVNLFCSTAGALIAAGIYLLLF